MDSTERKIDLVPPEEIDRALHESVRIGFSMPIDDCVPTVVSLLGFGRATQRIAAVVQERMAQLIQDGILLSKKGVVTLGGCAESESVYSNFKKF